MHIPNKNVGHLLPFLSGLTSFTPAWTCRDPPQSGRTGWKAFRPALHQEYFDLPSMSKDFRPTRYFLVGQITSFDYTPKLCDLPLIHHFFTHIKRQDLTKKRRLISNSRRLPTHAMKCDQSFLHAINTQAVPHNCNLQEGTANC